MGRLTVLPVVLIIIAQSDRNRVAQIYFAGNRTLVLRGNDQSVTLHASEATEQVRLRGCPTRSFHLLVAADGLTLATFAGGEDGLMINDLRTGRTVYQKRFSAVINAASISRAGRLVALPYIVTRKHQKTVAIEFISVSKKAAQIMETHINAEPRCSSFSHNEKLLAVGFDGGVIGIIDAERKKVIATTRTNGDAEITSLAFSSDGRQLASGSDDGTIALWHMKTMQSEELAVLRGAIMSMIFFKDSRRLLILSTANGPVLWDTSTKRVLKRYNSGNEGGMSLALSDDESTIAIAGRGVALVAVGIDRPR